MQDRKTWANLLTDDRTAENSEESKKKNKLLDCISKFNKVTQGLHNSQHNSGKEKKNEVLKLGIKLDQWNLDPESRQKSYVGDHILFDKCANKFQC